jgi:hypothetical protein
MASSGAAEVAAGAFPQAVATRTSDVAAVSESKRGFGIR